MSHAAAPLEQSIVGVGSSVTLRYLLGTEGGSYEITYTITEDIQSPEHGIYRRSSTLAGLLIGRALNDEVVIPQPEENIATGTIIAIY